MNGYYCPANCPWAPHPDAPATFQVCNEQAIPAGCGITRPRPKDTP